MDDKLTWEKLQQEQAWSDPYGRRRVDKAMFRLPNGEVADFYLKMDGDSAVVLAMTSEHQVILARQFRPGKEQVLLELPGGGIKKDQTPEEAAAAELLEETGYAGKMQFVA